MIQISTKQLSSRCEEYWNNCYMRFLTQSMNLVMSTLILLAINLLKSTSSAQEVDFPPPPPKAVSAIDSSPSSEDSRRFVLIVVGLPGDDEHAQRFEKVSSDWSETLRELVGVKVDRLSIVSGSEEDEQLTGARTEHVREVIGRLTEQLKEDDALWVFFLGHGSYDGQHTWFHLAGPDLHEGDWAGLFTRIRCHEQVFWLTQSASGGFVRALSRPNRIVIAATQPTGEVNETRFPHVLKDVLQNLAAETDRDGDGRLSVLELFLATNAEVESFFEENQLAATEHAQLDDNGDGKGSEADSLIKPGVEQTDANVPQIDGALAAKIFVTTIPAPKTPPAADESP